MNKTLTPLADLRRLDESPDILSPGSHTNINRTSLNFQQKLNSITKSSPKDPLSSLRDTSYKLNQRTVLPLITNSSLDFRSETLSPMSTKKIEIPITMPQSTRADIKKADAQKKFSLWEKITDLKISLLKYKDSSDDILYPSKTDLKKIIKCLELLNDHREDNSLRELMDIIIKILKLGLFVNPKYMKTYEEDIMDTQNDELKRIMQICSEEGIPYFSLTQALLRQITGRYARERMPKNAYEIKIQELNKLCQEKDQIINELREKLSQAVAREVLQAKEDEIDNLMKMVDQKTKLLTEYKAENSKLSNQLAEVQEENSIVKAQYDHEVAEVQKSVALVRHYENENKRILEQTEESRGKIREMKDKMRSFKDVLDKIIFKLKVIGQEVLELRKKNEDLQYDNDKLALRAAVGFDSLTPRPNYKKIIEETNIELDIYDPEGRKQMVSTVKITEHLAKKINELTSMLNKESTREGRGSVRDENRKRSASFVPSKRGGEMNKVKSNFALKPQRKSILETKESDDSPESPSPVTKEKGAFDFKLDLPKNGSENKFVDEILKQSDELLSQVIETKQFIERLDSFDSEEYRK